MRAALSDLRQAVRGLARAPAVALMVIFTLALGVGASTAVFTVVNVVLLRPLPYPDPERLVDVTSANAAGRTGGASGAAFLAWKEQGADIAAFAAYRQASFNLRGIDGPERLTGAAVTPGFFDVMGVRPLLGTPLAAAGHGVVVGEGLWRSRFDGARDLVGRAIVLGGEALTVEAVMPESFSFPPGSQLWVASRGPLPEHPLRPDEDKTRDWGSNYLDTVARLRPGVTLAQAQGTSRALGARLAQAHPDDRTFPRLVPLRDALVGSSRQTLLVMLGAVGLILLIGCVNVAHLLLARAAARRHEIAVRVALGARRAHVVRLFFAESFVLALAGGILGTVLSVWCAPLLTALGPGGLRPEAVIADAGVLAFAGAISLAVAVVFSVIPVLRSFVPAAALKEAGPGATSSRGRARSVLMAFEVALAVVLLAGAGLLLRSFARLRAVDPGFRAEGVLTVDVGLPARRPPEARIAFFRDVLERVAARPEVEAAGAVSRLPMTSGGATRDIGFERDRRDEAMNAELRVVTPGYFAALGIPVLRGRAFSDGDVPAAPRVAIVNALFARKAWGDDDPLGKRLVVHLDEQPSLVVGVIGNIRHAGLASEPRPQVYVPHALDPSWSFMTLVVKGRVPPETLAGPVRAAVVAAERDQPLGLVMTMEERIAGSLADRRFAMMLLGIAAGAALLLALVGIYGVVAYSVAQRRRELGIRLALGAAPRRLVAGVMLGALVPVGAGVAAGVGFALVGTRALGGLLFGVAPTDAPTYLLISTLAAGAAAMASFAAARRVTRVDAMAVLRGN